MKVIFLMVILAGWIVYLFIMKKRKGRKFRFYGALLPLLLFSVIAAADLGINYIASTVQSINDGIAIHTSLAYLIIGDEGWSTRLFKKYFDFSIHISIALLIVFSISRLVEE